MDINPVAKGHVLVIPKCQAVELSDLPLDYATAVMATAQKVVAAQRQVLGVTGVVMLQNNGEAAGQSVPHYHVHLFAAHYSAMCDDSYQDDASIRAELAQKLADAIKTQG